MSVVDDLRELAAGAVAGHVVPPAAQVRDVCTRAADGLERLEQLHAAANKLNWMLDGNACACTGPSGDCACIRSWNEAKAVFRDALELVDGLIAFDERVM